MDRAQGVGMRIAAEEAEKVLTKVLTGHPLGEKHSATCWVNPEISKADPRLYRL